MLASEENEISIILNDKRWIVIFTAGVTGPNGFVLVLLVEKWVVKYQISIRLNDEESVLERSLELREIGMPDLFSTRPMEDKFSFRLHDQLVLSVLTGQFFLSSQNFVDVKLVSMLEDWLCKEGGMGYCTWLGGVRGPQNLTLMMAPIQNKITVVLHD